MPLVTMKKYRSNNQLRIDDNLTKKIINFLAVEVQFFVVCSPTSTYVYKYQT